MDRPSSAASMLTRARISAAIVAAAAVASAGYVVYQAIFGPTELEPEPYRRLRRSHAVRHRRQSLPQIHHNRDHDGASGDAPPSEGTSTTSAEDELQGERNSLLPDTIPMVESMTVAEDQEDDWYDGHDGHDDHYDHDGHDSFQPRAGHSIVGLLFRVTEDNARRNAYVHRGCQCNSCGTYPIRGTRYRCANCADFDLCELCETQGAHIKTHIFYKIRVPTPRLGPRRMQAVWYPGDPDNRLRSLPKPIVTRLMRETGFERHELEAYWEQWTFMANTEWRDDPDELYVAMDRKTFEQYLVPSGSYHHAVPSLLHDRMFAFYDENNDGLIGFSEFLHGLSYRKGSRKLRKIFEGYDADRNGYVSRKDLLRLFRAYYVIYKQIQEDVIEGLDEQAMSSTEVNKLITGRQPLSSHFGRDSGMPPGESNRPMEGKIFCDDETYIADGKNRVVKDDKVDRMDRLAVLTKLFNEESESNIFVTTTVGHSRSEGEMAQYIQALVDPPTRVDQLPALLTRSHGTGDEILGNDSGVEDEQDEDVEQVEQDVQGQAAHVEEAAEGSAELGHATRRRSEEESRSWQGDGNSPPGFTTRKRTTRMKLFERWQKRHLYLDHEEGLVTPDGYPTDSDDEDPFDNLFKSVGVKNSQPAPAFSRSRSSSKVRFAEDTDEFEVRSNPSTSSRSVPERWGGMDIADAERDIGKEVLYQVVQQAFNELLDPIFAAAEEVALAAAYTKKVRDENRARYDFIDLEEEDRKARQKLPQAGADDALTELLGTSGHYMHDLHAMYGANDALMDTLDAVIRESQGEDEKNEVGMASGGLEETADRDPTMPQFRPSSLIHDQGQFGPKTWTESQGSGESVEACPHHLLVFYKRLDLVEKQAKERGGWGRISFAEFEAIYRREEQENDRLDYLGTWIDFCIPISH